MKNQVFINTLNKIINDNFHGNVSKYARAAGIPDSTPRTYLKRGSKPNPEILTKLAQAAGISITELYGEKHEKWTEAREGVVCEQVIHYEGQERRRNWPYSQEEQEFIGKLIAILRGKNKINITVIKGNINAFYATKDIDVPLEAKKVEGA